MAWTNNETFKFIELYKNEPSIWNPNCKFHKDRMKMLAAWKRISAEMEKPIDELKRKKESLMTGFRSVYKKKVQYDLKPKLESDEPYKPTWIFFDAMEDFLKNLYQCKIVYEEQDNQEDLSMLTDWLEPEESEEEKDTMIKQEINIEPKPKKRKKEDPLTIQATYLEDSYLSDAQDEENIECELYAKLVAKKLAKFQSFERQEIMYEIDGIILQHLRKKVENESIFNS